MIDMSITADMDDVRRRLGIFNCKADMIMSRAANRTVGKVNKTMRKEVSRKYLIKSSDVGKTIHVTKASVSKPSAKIVSTDVHSNLAKFKVSPNRRMRITKSGNYSPKVYKASVERSTGMSALSGSPKPFITTMKSNGFTGLFARKNDKGKAIRGIYGPAVPQMLKNKKIVSEICDSANKMMADRLKHEIDRELRKGV